MIHSCNVSSLPLLHSDTTKPLLLCVTMQKVQYMLKRQFHPFVSHIFCRNGWTFCHTQQA